MRVPIGVVGIIYESRPNVTADCAGLCLKSGNAVILKGGKESINSNLAIYKILRDALKRGGLPQGCIGIIDSKDRKSVSYLLGMDDYIDLIIPRGGEGLIRMVAKESRIPVIKHYKGICTVFVDDQADIEMAKKIDAIVFLDILITFRSSNFLYKPFVSQGRNFYIGYLFLEQHAHIGHKAGCNGRCPKNYMHPARFARRILRLQDILDN